MINFHTTQKLIYNPTFSVNANFHCHSYTRPIKLHRIKIFIPHSNTIIGFIPMHFPPGHPNTRILYVLSIWLPHTIRCMPVSERAFLLLPFQYMIQSLHVKQSLHCICSSEVLYTSSWTESSSWAYLGWVITMGTVLFIIIQVKRHLHFLPFEWCTHNLILRLDSFVPIDQVLFKYIFYRL